MPAENQPHEAYWQGAATHLAQRARQRLHQELLYKHVDAHVREASRLCRIGIEGIEGVGTGDQAPTKLAGLAAVHGASARSWPIMSATFFVSALRVFLTMCLLLRLTVFQKALLWVPLSSLTREAT